MSYSKFKSFILNLVYIVFTFTLCFQITMLGLTQPTLMGQIFIANILFVVIAILQGNMIIIYKTIGLQLLFVFFLIVFISTIIYEIQYRSFEFRSCVQFLFNFMYFLFVFKLKVKADIDKINKYIFIFTVLLSIYILFLFYYTGTYKIFSYFTFYHYRSWGKEYISGWPNSVPIPLLYGLYLIQNNKVNLSITKKVIFSILITVSIFLTTSRGGMLGAVLLIVYFLTKNKINLSHKQLIRFLSISIMLLLIMTVIRELFPSNLQNYLAKSEDRTGIYKASWFLIKQRPFMGYGGHSLDNIPSFFNKGGGGSMITNMNLQHTHNTILEIMLRYGFLGTICFIFLILYYFFKIKDQGTKFTFAVFWLLSLFQIFFRSFIFCFFIFMLIQNGEFNK